MKITNPANGGLLADIPDSTPLSLRQKWERALPAQRLWAAQPLPERLEVLRRFRALLVEKKEKLAQTLTSEVGKPIAQSRNEIEGTLGRVDFFLETVPKVLREEIVLKDSAQKLEEKITLEPLGVILNVSAWNYPYYVGS